MKGRKGLVQAVAFPNLPQGRVTMAAVSDGDREILQALRNLGIEPLLVGKSPQLDAPVSSHADMRLHYLGGGKIVVEKDDEPLYHACICKGLHPQYALKALQKSYPQDVGLNCFILGNYLIGLSKSIDAAICDWYLSHGFQTLDVPQGYAKCSAAIVSQSAVITADPSLEKALCQAGFDCLRVTSGHVSLRGYACGFLGGACFLSSPHTLCFLGELSTHPDAADIRTFCRKHGVQTQSLLKGELRDAGSVLPLFCFAENG